MLETSGNIIALLVFVGWPFVMLAFFKNMRVQTAIFVSVVTGYLFLPTQTSFDLPGFPTITKETLPIAVATLLAVIFMKQNAAAGLAVLNTWRPKSWMLLLVLLWGASIVASGLTNSDALRYGPVVLPGIRPYDIASQFLGFSLLVLPALVARRYFASPDSHRLILVVLVVCGLLYSLPALFEVRMSPQLNRMVYGFFPHSWTQHIRGDGFRPIVFLNHGLLVAIFFSMVTLAALACIRATIGATRTPYLVAAAWLFFTLVLCKSVAAFLIMAAIAPIILLLNARLQLMAAAGLAAIVLLYPMARSADIIPVDQILSSIEGYDSRAAASMGTRIYHEDQILEKANERPAFGWSGWSRWRVFDDRGRDITISDGAWVIIFGTGGWAKYIAVFGLLCLPIILIYLQRNRQEFGFETSGLALVLVANLVDSIPNDSLTPITWLLAGALWGRLEWQASTDPQATPATASPRTDRQYVRGPVATDPTRGGEPVYTRQTARISRS